MRLTRAAEYAIRCVIHLARQGQGVLTSRREIARQANIPAHFLVKIAQELARAGLIEIRQGARGGFLLRRPPGEISLLEVVEIMIGEIFLNDCIARPGSCAADTRCNVHRVWHGVRNQLRQTLAQVRFDQLAEEGACPTARAFLSLEPNGNAPLSPSGKV